MKKIIHVLDIKKPRVDVFRALTTSEGLGSWWSKQVKAEAREGAVVDFTFLDEFNPDMEITALDAPGRLKWKCIGGHEPWQDNTFQFLLVEQDSGTRLTFAQDYATELDDVAYGIYNFNWGYYLESLRKYVETGKGTPFDPVTGRSE